MQKKRKQQPANKNAKKTHLCLFSLITLLLFQNAYVTQDNLTTK